MNRAPNKKGDTSPLGRGRELPLGGVPRSADAKTKKICGSLMTVHSISFTNINKKDDYSGEWFSSSEASFLRYSCSLSLTCCWYSSPLLRGLITSHGSSLSREASV